MCSPGNLLHIFRTPFSGWLLLNVSGYENFGQNVIPSYSSIHPKDILNDSGIGISSD